jgi:hypothetical protein
MARISFVLELPVRVRFLTTLCCFALLAPLVRAQPTLDVARYTATGELHYPGDLDTWVLMGASLGSDYNDQPFSADHPGTIGVVQMEPAAYQHYLEHGSYVDGTMFLLSFFEASAQSSPQLQGFVQGARRIQEIHVIDRERFSEDRAFFVYPVAGAASVAPIADASECVACHMEHGAYDGTFVQFYPTLRDRP